LHKIAKVCYNGSIMKKDMTNNTNPRKGDYTMNNTMRRDDGQYVVWADGSLGSSKTSIKVFHSEKLRLAGKGVLAGTPLCASHSEDRCNQVAERMVAAQTDYLIQSCWVRRTVADTNFSNKTAESIKVLLLKDFTDTIQRIVDSAVITSPSTMGCYHQIGHLVTRRIG